MYIERNAWILLHYNEGAENLQVNHMEKRLATIQDIPIISRIHAASWKVAYQGIVPQAYLDTLPEDYWVESFTQWLQDGALQALIAWEGDTAVGCVSYGKQVSSADLEQLPPDYGEIRSIYIHPDFMRRGYGKVLLHDAELALRIQGYSHCSLYVLEQNLSARAFYEKHGYTWEGTIDSFCILGQEITEMRYVKSLACPCPRRCKTHGDCVACKEKHTTKKYPCYCLR